MFPTKSVVFFPPRKIIIENPFFLLEQQDFPQHQTAQAQENMYLITYSLYLMQEHDTQNQEITMHFTDDDWHVILQNHPDIQLDKTKIESHKLKELANKKPSLQELYVINIATIQFDWDNVEPQLVYNEQAKQKTFTTWPKDFEHYSHELKTIILEEAEETKKLLINRLFQAYQDCLKLLNDLNENNETKMLERCCETHHTNLTLLENAKLTLIHNVIKTQSKILFSDKEHRKYDETIINEVEKTVNKIETYYEYGDTKQNWQDFFIRDTIPDNLQALRRKLQKQKLLEKHLNHLTQTQKQHNSLLDATNLKRDINFTIHIKNSKKSGSYIETSVKLAKSREPKHFII